MSAQRGGRCLCLCSPRGSWVVGGGAWSMEGARLWGGWTQVGFWSEGRQREGGAAGPRAWGGVLAPPPRSGAQCRLRQQTCVPRACRRLEVGDRGAGRWPVPGTPGVSLSKPPLLRRPALGLRSQLCCPPGLSPPVPLLEMELGVSPQELKARGGCGGALRCRKFWKAWRKGVVGGSPPCGRWVGDGTGWGA